MREKIVTDEMIEGIAIVDYQWKCLYVNKIKAGETQISYDDMVGRIIFQKLIGGESSILFKLCQSVMSDRIPQQAEKEFTYSNGSKHWFWVSVAPIPEGIFIQSMDITGKKLEEKKVLELLQFAECRTAELIAIIESIPDAVFVGTSNGVSLCNAKALKLLGANSLDDLKIKPGALAKKLNFRQPDPEPPLKEKELRVNRALKGETFEEEVVTTNVLTGEDLIIRVAGAPVMHNGKIIAAVTVESDITEKKQIERMIKASLKEKEVLLRELYHRTKNNMQVISSLLSLKAASIKDKEMIIILNDMMNRIMTIAQIHDMLHQSDDLTQIDLGDYITTIVNLLNKSFSDTTEKIKIKLELEQINVHIDTAIYCGLVVNELITNSLKYAFPGDRKGNILVKLSKPEDKIELHVSDDGIGFVLKKIYEGRLGLQIIRLIVEEQLNGKINIQSKNGISVNLCFYDNKYESRKINTLELKNEF
jgi:two-component sensor histidine kinase